jgi:hypothetical protein
VLANIDNYALNEELQEALKEKFGKGIPISTACVLTALHEDLRLSRKVLERCAREAISLEVDMFKVVDHPKQGSLFE